MCFVEVIDTAGQGGFILLSFIQLALSYFRVMTLRGVRNITRSVGSVGLARLFILAEAPHNDWPISEGQGFILVYSIASRATFDRLEVFRQSMLRVKRQKPIFMLVGNKADKQLEREVTREEGMQLAREFGCEFLETSAKTAQNVERLFTNLVRSLRSTRQTEQGVVVPPQPRVRARQRCSIM